MSDITKYDVAVIGGGLAGLSLAIQLSDKGYQVVLFEKENYPFHKVCGEYISLESWPFLQQLGVQLSQWDLPVIKKLRVSDAFGRRYNFNLPLGGFGISRYKLDNELYKIALQKGVTVFNDTRVSDITFNSKAFLIETSKGSFTAAVAAGCYGKRSNIDLKLHRSFIKQKPNKLNNYIGIKYHIQYDHPSDTIALHNFKNGYCGISKIEENKLCLCYLTTASNLSLHNNSIDEMQRNVIFKNGYLKDIFKKAFFLYDRPLAISQISFNKKCAIENHILMIGDAAGLITPLCGNGMSMAMHASKIASNYIDQFLQKKTNRPEMEQLYTTAWQRQFGTRIFAGRMVQSMFGGNLATSMFLKTMHAFPGVAKRIISSTHGSTF